MFSLWETYFNGVPSDGISWTQTTVWVPSISLKNFLLISESQVFPLEVFLYKVFFFFSFFKLCPWFKSICIYLYALFENTVLEIFMHFPKFDDAYNFGFVIQQVNTEFA